MPSVYLVQRSLIRTSLNCPIIDLALYARDNVHVRYQTATELLNDTRSNDRRPTISALRRSITSERGSIPARLVPVLNKRRIEYFINHRTPLFIGHLRIIGPQCLVYLQLTARARRVIFVPSGTIIIIVSRLFYLKCAWAICWNRQAHAHN
jgi:hypothetical protein